MEHCPSGSQLMNVFSKLNGMLYLYAMLGIYKLSHNFHSLAKGIESNDNQIILFSSLQEHNLEFAVIDILQEAGAEEYIPKFARHRVSIETMMQMGLDELKEVINWST